MMILEAAPTGGMVYQSSNRAAPKPPQSILLNKLMPWLTAGAYANHTLLSSLEQGGADSFTKPVMDSPTYSRFDLTPKQDQPKALEEKLFDAKAEAKVLTSYVSMYLRQGWRDKFFAQLDDLLDADGWDKRDQPLQKKSFDTFLKAICDLSPTVRPGLGLTYGGNLIAAWTTRSNDRLTLEFEQDGSVQMIVTRFHDNEPEIFSGRVKVARLKSTLHDFKCQTWIGCD
jgi:hypothetical protein